MFLQDTHSSSEDKQKWRDNFSGNIFFSHGKRNSCGVLISYIETHNFFVNNKKTDNDGQILILDVTINDADFVLINLYHANTETEQVSVLNNLSSLLPNFDVSLEKKSILAGDFNLFSESKLDAKGGKPVIKKSLSKTYSVKKVCGIWRVKNLITNIFTFRQKHCTSFIQRRLDYIFVSNSLQQFVNATSILTFLSTDHSPIHLSLLKQNKHTKCNRF